MPSTTEISPGAILFFFILVSIIASAIITMLKNFFHYQNDHQPSYTCLAGYENEDVFLGDEEMWPEFISAYSY